MPPRPNGYYDSYDEEAGVEVRRLERVATIVSFIDDDAAVESPATFGFSTYNHELQRYAPAELHLDLLHDLSRIIPETFARQESHFTIDWLEADSSKWDQLSQEIMKSQKNYEQSKSGFWHRMWYGVGDKENMIDPWLNLIPNDYGIAIVKTGVAMILKLAEKSRLKKEKIVETFTGLADILKRYKPDEIVFSDDPKVRKQAEGLYHAVVDSIRDMLEVTSGKRSRIQLPRGIKEFLGKEYTPRPPTAKDPEQILQDVMDHAAEFDRAVGQARDGTIQRTNKTVQNVDKNVQAVGAGLALTYNMGKAVKQNTERIMRNVSEASLRMEERIEFVREQSAEAVNVNRKGFASLEMSLEKIAKQHRRDQARIVAREQARQKDQVDSKNNMMGILMDQLRQKDIQIAKLQAALSANYRNPPSFTPPKPVLSPDAFSALLAGRRNVADFSAQANLDLSRALQQRGRPRSQAQANSTLQNPGFKEWLAAAGSGLVLVNANLVGEPERMSAMSLFAATLVASMAAARPDAVVVHYFCGLHASPTDAEFGPGGMLRVLAMQLVLQLVDVGNLSIGFLNKQQFVDNLRSTDPATACSELCQTLCGLLELFPAGTEIYWVIDAISWFDRERTFGQLEIVMGCLQTLVEDPSLPPVLKVLLTNSGHASLRLQSLPVFRGRPERLVNLPPNSSASVGLSPRAIGRHIARPLTPTPGASRRGGSRLSSGGSWHEDEYDHGYETD